MTGLFTRDRTMRFSLGVALLAALHSLLWTAIMPPGTGGDEEGHFAVVEHIANKGSLPILMKDFALTKNMRNLLDAMEHSTLITDPFQKPRFAAPPDAQLRDEFDPNFYVFGSAGGPPLHYLTLLPAYHLVRDRPLLTRFYAVRAFGLVFAALTAFMAHRTMLRLSKDRSFADAVAVIIACLPMPHFIFGCVTNDGGTITIVAAGLYLAVRLATGETDPRLAFGLGLLTGTAALFKPFAVSLGIPLFVLVISRSNGRRAAMLHAALFVVGVALLVAPWAAWSTHHYGGLTMHSRMAAEGEKPGLFEIMRRFNEIASPGGLFSQAFGVFGRLCTPLPKWLRGIGAVVFLGGWVAFAWRVARGREERAWLWIAVIPLVHVVVVFGLSYWTLHQTGFRLGMQGRYFIYPLLALVAPMLKGWFDLLPKYFPTARIAVALALFLTIYSLGWVVIPRYYL